MKPREIADRAPDPCGSLFTDQHREQLDLLEAGKPRLVLGRTPSCRWEARQPRRTVTVVIDLEDDLFVNTYRARLLPIFRPVEVGGLPAVEEQSSADSSLCTTTVGVSEGQSLDVTISIDEFDGGRPTVNPCAEARRVVEAVVATLPPA